jgi:hypothetical protein
MFFKEITIGPAIFPPIRPTRPSSIVFREKLNPSITSSEAASEIHPGESSMSKRMAEVANLPSAAAAAPVLERTTQHFIDALAAASGPPFYTLTPQAARKVLIDSLARADGHFTASKLLLKISAAR